MLENLTIILYCHPRVCRKIGAAICKLGGFGLLAGFLAQVGTVAASRASGLAHKPPITSIEQLLPGVWTWWVPETFIAFFSYFLITATGAALAFAAKDAERQLRCR